MRVRPEAESPGRGSRASALVSWSRRAARFPILASRFWAPRAKFFFLLLATATISTNQKESHFRLTSATSKLAYHEVA